MPVIGVDLDNTIISYDSLLHRVSVENGFIGPTATSAKKVIRDCIRKLPDGEVKWQKIQAEMYGSRMSEANLFEGVRRFFTECRLRDLQVYIVSHKTEYANYAVTRLNLRQNAMNWLHSQGFFESKGIGFDHRNVFFESSRQEKIERISMLGCTHFVDDLEETFFEPSFPPHIMKILFDPHHQYPSRPGVHICNSWPEICSFLLGSEHDSI